MKNRIAELRAEVLKLPASPALDKAQNLIDEYAKVVDKMHHDKVRLLYALSQVLNASDCRCDNKNQCVFCYADQVFMEVT